MRLHRRAPALEEVARHLHRRVHADAVNVARGNQRLGHGDDLVLHPGMRGAQVVQAAVDLPEMILPGIAVVAQVAVVMQVAIQNEPLRCPPADTRRRRTRRSSVPVLIERVVHREIHVGLAGRAREQAVLAVVQAERRAIGRMPFKVIEILQMVDDDVHDDIQAERVGLGHHRAEILHGAKALVQQREINLPVAVVGIGAVLEHRRDPDRLVAERANVFQPVAHPEEIPAMPRADIPQVIARVGQLVVGGLAVTEPVRDELIDRDLAPVIRRGEIGVVGPGAVVIGRVRARVEVHIPGAVLRSPRRGGDDQE